MDEKEKCCECLNCTCDPCECTTENLCGCDEDLVGHYGMTDPSFWYKAKDKVKVEIKENLYLKHMEEGAADIVRDTSVNRRLVEEKKKNNSWSTDYIRFKWRKVNTYMDVNNIKLI